MVLSVICDDVDHSLRIGLNEGLLHACDYTCVVNRLRRSILKSAE